MDFHQYAFHNQYISTNFVVTEVTQVVATNKYCDNFPIILIINVRITLHSLNQHLCLPMHIPKMIQPYIQQYKWIFHDFNHDFLCRGGNHVAEHRCEVTANIKSPMGFRLYVKSLYNSWAFTRLSEIRRCLYIDEIHKNNNSRLIKFQQSLLNITDVPNSIRRQRKEIRRKEAYFDLAAGSATFKCEDGSQNLGPDPVE